MIQPASGHFKHTSLYRHPWLNGQEGHTFHHVSQLHRMIKTVEKLRQFILRVLDR